MQPFLKQVFTALPHWRLVYGVTPTNWMGGNNNFSTALKFTTLATASVLTLILCSSVACEGIQGVARIQVRLHTEGVTASAHHRNHFRSEVDGCRCSLKLPHWDKFLSTADLTLGTAYEIRSRNWIDSFASSCRSAIKFRRETSARREIDVAEKFIREQSLSFRESRGSIQ